MVCRHPSGGTGGMAAGAWAMRAAATTALVTCAWVAPARVGAQVPTCETAARGGDILVAQFGGALYRVDPNAVKPPGAVISYGYESIVFDAGGRLIGKCAAQILHVDLNKCTETVISENGSLADAPDMIVIGDFLYATDDSGGIRGVIEVDLRNGAQRLVTSSAPIKFPSVGNFRSPSGITADDEGYLYVVDQGSPLGGTDGRIVRVDPEMPYDPDDPQANQKVIASGSNASLPGSHMVYNEMQDPLGIAIDTVAPYSGDLLVTDQGRIMRFRRADGKLTQTISLGVALTLTHDIEIDAGGNYIVAGHDIYGTINAVLHVARHTGEVTQLAPTLLVDVLARPQRVAVVPSICGDADGSGNVTASDALAILRAAVGGSTCAACTCDVDVSGAVTATDALMALTKSVGLEIDLRCSPCA